MNCPRYLETPGLNLSPEHPFMAEDFRVLDESCREKMAA